MSPAPTLGNGHQTISSTHQVVKNGNDAHRSDGGKFSSAVVISMEHEYGAHK